MPPQAATSSSDSTSQSEIFGIISSADAIAIVAVAVSAYTWFRSRTIEERIRLDSDERSKFDLVFGNPVTAKLDPLENIHKAFGTLIRNGSSMSGIAANISSLQKNEHSEWYFSLTSFLHNHEGSISELLNSALNEYWDQSSFLVNELSNASSKERAITVFRQLQSLGEGYLARSRKILVEKRTSIRATPARILRIPFFGN
jgi:hypothetical protein